MTSSTSDLTRRQVMVAGALVGAGFLAGPAAAQTTTATALPDTSVSDGIAAEFLNGATPVKSGLVLDLPVIGDNPAAVPVRVHVTDPINDQVWCEEIIVLAERNPYPLTSRLRFTQAAGSADFALRLRLVETMHVRALARMSDGRVLEARQEINVAAGGCGM